MRLAQKSILEVTGFVSVMVITALTRLWNLGYPAKLVFDETYYVKDALTLSLEGHEKSWPDGADVAFQSGDVFGYLGQAAFVVHPPLGKWIIATGIWIAGPDQSTGWRLSTALLGIATVGLLMLVALKLFRSVPVAILAGFLMAIDGLAITLSRTALLDSSLTFFLLLGFWFFLFDQQSSRVKIIRAIERSRNSILWFRPWLILSGIALGAASSIKWSGLYLLAGIGVYVVMSESLLRKNLGELNWFRKGFLLQGVFSFLSLVPAALAIYLLTWIGWIFSKGGYARNWAIENPLTGFVSLLPDWMPSLWHYHEVIYRFHINLTTEHAYQAHPLGWLVGFRPTAFFYESYPAGTNGCEISNGCSSAITALGNPFIWICSSAALIYISYRYSRHRESVLGLVLLGTASLYLPWIVLSERTVFQFYVVSFQPWLILGLVFAVQQLRRKLLAKSKAMANLATAGFVSLVFGSFFFFLPVNTGMYLPFELWQWRMWLPSWI
jgi:dolichyl-phosphate-mannose--protein O-mannosyl transferase